MLTPEQARRIFDEIQPPDDAVRRLLGDSPKLRSLAESILNRAHRSEAMDLADELFKAGVDWHRTIKIIRWMRKNTIAEAQALVLSHPGWLRWAKRQVTTNPACAKRARYAATHGSLPDWIGLRDGQPAFLR